MQATGGVATTAALSGYLGVDVPGAGLQAASQHVKDTVAEMSLDEKIGQMTQVAAYEMAGADDPKTYFEKYKPGSLMYTVSSDPTEQANEANRLQKAAEEVIGVPFVYGLDAVHGNNNLEGATIFTHNHGLGATWNEEYAFEMAEITGKTLRVTGSHWNFSPVADICRDPRWGRFYEGFSEDPYLASQMVASKVRGYEQKTEGYKRTGATVKHFAGYSAPRNGNDRTAALVPFRTFRHTILPPFAAGIDAGGETVMVNSGSLNGIPAHASEELLTEILREMLGFSGMTVSDWHDFYRMVSVHGFAADLKEATKLGINAGVDMYMVPAAGIEGDDVEGYQTRLKELVESGDVSMDRIDEAVTRILTFKEQVGLFTDPYADPDAVEDVVSEGRELAREIATDSMTLLQNDDTLPLGSDVGTVFVTGPSADSVENQMGGWTLGWQQMGEDANPPAVTVLEGIQEAAPDGTSVIHEPTGLTTFDNEDSVREHATDADVAVAVVGEGPYAEEKGDTDTLELADAQQDLVETLANTGTPVVGVIIAGRPRGTEVFDQFDASLMAYLPGTAAGPAVADTLFGENNPSGRLPFTWPEGTGQLLNVLNHYPPAEFASSEDDRPPESDPTPLFEFGHGESYTEFSYEGLTLAPSSLPEVAQNDEVNVSVTVTNTGDAAGDTVVPVYAGREHGPVLYGQKQVVGYERVSLDPGASKKLTVKASILPLATVPGDVFSREELQVLPGEYWVRVGEMTETLTVK